MEDHTKEIFGIEIDENMPDFSNDPFFVEKLAQAKKRISEMSPADWALIDEIIEKYK